MKQTITRLLPWAASWLLGVSSTQAQVTPSLPARQALPTRLLPSTPVPHADGKHSPRRAQAPLQASASTAPGLEWVARYAGPGNIQDKVDVATILVVDAAGNVYVTGRSRQQFRASSNDYATVKYSPSGQQLWVARYDKGYDDVPVDLAVDAAGNVFVTGRSFNDNSGDDYATIKYSASGQPLWTARYNSASNGADKAVGMVLDAAGNAYVTGTSPATGTALDYVTVKYAPGGQRLWEARYTGGGSDGDDEAAAIQLDPAGNVVVTGTSKPSRFSGNQDYATVKYTASGLPLWQARYSGSENADDLPVALTVDAAGNVVVTGTSNPDGHPDYATVKYTANGQQLWNVRYQGVLTDRSLEQAFDVAVDAAGDVFVTGRSRNPTKGEWDYATLKYAAVSGQQLWEARYDGSTGESEDNVTDLTVNAAGDVYVTGASNGDYGTLKYAGASGQQLWALYYTLSSSSDAAQAVAVDAADNVYVTGASGGGPTDFATLKYGVNTINQVPTASAAATTPLTLPTTSTRLSGTGTDPDGTIVGYSWTQVSGPNQAIISRRDQPTTLVYNLVAGTYVFSLEVTDNGGQRSAPTQTTLTVNPEPADGRVLYRVNAGGGQVTNSLGTFAADPFNANGATFATDQPIAGTADDAIYQSERYGRYFRYRFAVSRGKQYEVVLHFAEVYATRAGQRVFDVAAEGLVVLDNYDIYQKVGAFTATTERLLVTAADEELSLDFYGGVDNAKVSAIEIYTVNSTPTITAVLRLNAGSGQLSTSTGPFAADQYATGGSDFASDQAIAGTEDDALYQTERYGAFTYNLPVPNGQYTVKLHFAELYWNSTGQRVFNVAAEGSTVLQAYDIVKKVGPLTATTETFPVTVTDGVLSLAFAPGAAGVDQPKVSAIEVLQASPTAVLRLNVGGGQLSTSVGRFTTDQFAYSGRDFATTAAIAGTEDDALYQTERYGTFSYGLPVLNGTYTVKLHFAELYWNAPGQRVFDVAAEGTTVLQAYDIVKKVGPLTATTESFSVTVTDGLLLLDFAPGASGVDQPKVSAIEVLSESAVSPIVAAARTAASPLATGAAAKLPVYSAQVKLYPNPSADGRVTVELPAAFQGEVSYALVSSLGTTLRQGQRTVSAAGQSLTFDFSQQMSAEGLYYLHLRGAKGQAHVKLLRK